MNITATGGAQSEAPQDFSHGHAQGSLLKLAVGADYQLTIIETKDVRNAPTSLPGRRRR